MNHTTERDVGLCCPTYRGYRIACVGDEIPALQGAIDDHWNRRYLAAETPAAKVAVLVEERVMRHEPKDWTP